MRRFYYFLVLAVLAAMVAGCDQTGGCNGAQTITLTEADSGRVIDMDLIDRLEIVLSSNPSTGYSWQNVFIEGSIMVQVGDAVYAADPSCGNRTGCGGTQTFSFKAVAAGTGRIKLIYLRPWSQEAPIAQFELTVIVH